jgi:heat shock protein HslJ
METTMTKRKVHAAIMGLALLVLGLGGLVACSPPKRVAVVTAVTADSLMGVQWSAVDIDGAALVVEPRPTMRWTTPQQMVGTGGCNQFRGRVTLVADGLRIGPIGGVGVACVSAPGGQEDLFFQALENTRKARLEDGQLVLLDAADKTLARFTAR